VFAIGSSLREARTRQGLEFDEMETRTKVRAKYLRMLEEERFDQLPGHTYTKGFLRVYADALGLDGRLYVDEYNSRFVTGEEDVPLRPRDYQRRPPPIGRRFEARGILVALGAIAILFALFIAAWKFSSNGPKPVGLTPKHRTAKKKHTRPTVTMTRLVLTAVDGDSWLLVRGGSASGKQLYVGTLQQGSELAFSRRPWLYPKLWVAVSKPKNLVAQVNGHVRLIPGHGKAEQLLVTPKGIVKAPPAA
jgi:transcriptional regulator with XRE-family HTH domain